LVFATSTIPLTALAQQTDTKQPQAQETAAAAKLSNKDIADLHKAGLAPQIIVAKIKSSATDFDTSPAALQELKTAGLPDEVILAMVQASAGSVMPTTATPAAAGATTEIKVPDGTQIEIELVNNVSGQEVKVGDLVASKTMAPLQTNAVTALK